MKKFSFILITALIAWVMFSVSFNQGLDPAAYSAVIDTEWQLTITGLVNTSLNLKLADLIAMPQSTIFAQIYCVGPPSFFVEEGNWTGVKLGLLLEKAGISHDVIKVAFYASDGFSTDLTIEAAMSENVIVAYEKDGVPLDEKLRLVVPGRWGYKWIYNLNRIELVDYNFLGRYERGDYSDSAEITQSGAPINFNEILPDGTRLNRTPYPSPSPSTTPKPSPTATPKPNGDLTGTPTPSGLAEEITYVIAATAAISVVILCLIVYFVKVKKKTRTRVKSVR